MTGTQTQLNRIFITNLLFPARHCKIRQSFAPKEVGKELSEQK